MNIATNTLKKLVAQWVRGWLPFVVVTKGGWLGYTKIQSAVDYCGARGGGLVFIGPGTYNEAVDLTEDYVNIVGCGMGVTVIKASGANVGLTMTGDYCSAYNLQIDSEEGGGGYEPGVKMVGDYGLAFRILNNESDGDGFKADSAGMAQVVSHCIIPADNHDGYAVTVAGPKCIFTSNSFRSGGGYNFMIEGTGDEIVMAGNIIDGDGGGSTIYGIVINTNAENCLVSANWVGNFLTQNPDIWDKSGTSTTVVPDGGGPLNEIL